MKYKIAEKFLSINGEGCSSGYLSTFIRFAGCNLSCVYCDTKWANENECPYILMSSDEILNYIKSNYVKNVTLTGGEPLVQNNIKSLLILLSKEASLKIEIETNGSVDISPFLNIGDNISFTLDYKLRSSCMEEKMHLQNFNKLRSNDCVKFVIGSYEDLERAKYIIDNYDLVKKCSVHFSPVYEKYNMINIIDFIKTNKMTHVKFQPQIHKIIWGANCKGV